MALEMREFRFIFDTGISLVEMIATALTPEQALKQTHQKFMADRQIEPMEVYWEFRYCGRIYAISECLPGHSWQNRKAHPIRNYYGEIELRDEDWGIFSNLIRSLPRQAK